jgi:hypothetical protein
MDSQKAGFSMESRGGKRGAKELVSGLRNRLHNNGALGSGSDSPHLSHQASSMPVQTPLNALETMLMRKAAEASARASDADLNDYHIITHKKDARQCKVAEIGGRRLGRRFDRAAGANFDMGLLSTLGQQRDKRVAAISDASLSSRLPSQGRGAAPEALAPAFSILKTSFSGSDQRSFMGSNRKLRSIRSSVDFRSDRIDAHTNPSPSTADSVHLKMHSGSFNTKKPSRTSSNVSFTLSTTQASAEDLGSVLDSALQVEDDGISSDEDATAPAADSNVSMVNKASFAKEFGKLGTEIDIDSPGTADECIVSARNARGSVQLSLDDLYPDRRSYCEEPPFGYGENFAGPVMSHKFSLPRNIISTHDGELLHSSISPHLSRPQSLQKMSNPASASEWQASQKNSFTQEMTSSRGKTVADSEDHVVLTRKRSSLQNAAEQAESSSDMPSTSHSPTNLDEDDANAMNNAKLFGMSLDEEGHERVHDDEGLELLKAAGSSTIRHSEDVKRERLSERTPVASDAVRRSTTSITERLSEFMIENAERFHFKDSENENEEDIKEDSVEPGDQRSESRHTSVNRRRSDIANNSGNSDHSPGSNDGHSGDGEEAVHLDAANPPESASGSLYWWDLKPSEGGTWNPAARLWRAGIYCQDAINERPIKLYRAARRPLQVYALVQSNAWNTVYVTASLCHLALLLFEPASWGVVDPDTLAYTSVGLYVLNRNLHAYPHFDGKLIAAVEGLVLLIYAIDSALSLYALGFADMFGVGVERRLLRITNGDDTHYFEDETCWQRTCRRSRSLAAWFTCGLVGARRKKHGSKGDSASSANTRFEKTRLFLWMCMAVDLLWSLGAADLFLVMPAIFTSAHTLRWSRPFRAIMPMVASAELRRWSKMILLTLPEILVLLCFLILVMTIYGIIGIHLFSSEINCYSAANQRARAADGTVDDNEYPAYIVNAFQNIGYALISMYVLSSTENYPVVMYPAYDCHPKRRFSADASTETSSTSDFDQFYASFFVSFLVIIMFGINVLSVPMLYSGLLKHIKADAVVGRRLERTALHAAFELLDVEDRGFLTEDQFACLVRELRPDLFIDFKVAAAALVAQRAARRRAINKRRARTHAAMRPKPARSQEHRRSSGGVVVDTLSMFAALIARAVSTCVGSVAQACGLVWQQFLVLVGRDPARHVDYGTAYEACYPEIRKLRYFEAVPRGYMLVQFSPETAPGAAASAKAKRRGGGLRFCVRDPTATTSAAKSNDSSVGDNFSSEAAFAASGGFVEKPHFAGAVQLMFGQLARFDDNDDEAEGKIGPMEFFRVPEVVLRDFRSVEVLKQRDSLYTQLFGKHVGAACGSVRDRLLFDGFWKSALRGLDLCLTFAHVVVLAAHVNVPATSSVDAQPVEDAAARQRWNLKLYEASFAITAVVCAVLAVKAIVLRPKRFFKSKNNRMDLIVLPLALGCITYFRNSPSPYRDIGAMIMSLRLLRLVLSVPLFKKLYVILVGKEYLIFTLQSVFLFIALWATVGMMLFSGAFGDSESSLSSAAGSGLTDPNIGFDTFSTALFTMFQVFTSSNWHEIMYRGMETPNLPRFTSPTFFISFHYFCTTVVMQLMIAILVEMYIQISSDPSVANMLSSEGNFERASTASTVNHNSSSMSLINGLTSARNSKTPTIIDDENVSNAHNGQPGAVDPSMSGMGDGLSGSSTHGSSPQRGIAASSPNGKHGARARADSSNKPAMAVAKRTHLLLNDGDDNDYKHDDDTNNSGSNHEISPRNDRLLTLDGPPRSHVDNIKIDGAHTPGTESDAAHLAKSAEESSSADSAESGTSKRGVLWGDDRSARDGAGLVELVSTSISEGDEEGVEDDEESMEAMMNARHATRAKTMSAPNEGLPRRESSSDAATPRSESTPRSDRASSGGPLPTVDALRRGSAYVNTLTAPNRSRNRTDSSSVSAAGRFGGQGAGPPRMKLIANEASFKATTSALHVLARRTDQSAFDAVDRELQEGNDLVRGVASSISYSSAPHAAHGEHSGSSSSNGGGGGSGGRSRGKSGDGPSLGGINSDGRDSRRGSSPERPSANTRPRGRSFSHLNASDKKGGPVSLRTLGTLAVASAREAIRAAAAAEARAQAAAAEVDEIATLLAGASSGKQVLTPEQVARVQEVMRTQVDAQRAADAAALAAEEADKAARPGQHGSLANVEPTITRQSTL